MNSPIDPAPTSPPLNSGSEHHIYNSSKYLREWHHNLPRQPVPVPNKPFGEEVIPNIQSKPLALQPKSVFSCSVTGYWGEETDPHLSATSFQRESDNVSSQPPTALSSPGEQHYWPAPAGCHSIHQHPLGTSIIHFFYTGKSAPIQAMSSQFLLENAVGNAVKIFTEVRLDTFPAFPSSTKWITLSQKEIRWLSRTCLSWTHASLACSPGCPACAAWGTEDDLLHELPQLWGQAERPVVP